MVIQKPVLNPISRRSNYGWTRASQRATSCLAVRKIISGVRRGFCSDAFAITDCFTEMGATGPCGPCSWVIHRIVYSQQAEPRIWWDRRTENADYAEDSEDSRPCDLTGPDSCSYRMVSLHVHLLDTGQKCVAQVTKDSHYRPLLTQFIWQRDSLRSCRKSRCCPSSQRRWSIGGRNLEQRLHTIQQRRRRFPQTTSFATCWYRHGLWTSCNRFTRKAIKLRHRCLCTHFFPHTRIDWCSAVSGQVRRWRRRWNRHCLSCGCRPRPNIDFCSERWWCTK